MAARYYQAHPIVLALWQLSNADPDHTPTQYVTPGAQ